MRRVLIVTAAVAGLLAPAATATATASAAATGGWQPAPTPPFTISGVCDFTMKGDIVEDATMVRTDATYPDGSPRVQEFDGPLVIRFINAGTGRSVVRDVSGYARLRYLRDGGLEYQFDGGGSIPVRVGSPGFPKGWYIMRGRFTVVGHDDGTRVFSHVHATVEDLCRTLA